jgi:uncharacterized protein
VTWIDDENGLRDHYRDPSQLVLDKSIDRIDEGAAGFLAAATLAVVATSGPDGNDASPRGGPPGFVRVLDPGHVAFGDLAGNNRLDTYTNITTHPQVGLLMIVPGLEETLRINGRARMSTDPAVLEATAIDERTPKVAVVIEVSECYIHCAKALRRSGIWDRSQWPEVEARPSPAAIITRHLDLDVDPALVAADLEKGYEATLWMEGGK